MASSKHKPVIMHIDVNSAYLSWQAVYELQQGAHLDIRRIPAVVGGSQKDRKGIVLAKSIPAKSFGIVTGEPLWEAYRKCPDLLVRAPNYHLYMKCSNALKDLLNQYFPAVQRFSVDEFFVDYTGMERDYGDPVAMAHRIKNEIRSQMGFTVNIGIGENKLLAKMAGELKKPDMVHTLWPHELKEKLWPLPVEELYMVGRKTAQKLKGLNIHTIGALANTDLKLLRCYFKSFGEVIWSYANGFETSPVVNDGPAMKGLGHSSTIKFDVADQDTAHKILLALTEATVMRLRESGFYCQLVTVAIRSSNLSTYSHQRKLFSPTNSTREIYQVVKELFDECWHGEKVRLLGVRLGELSEEHLKQLSLFDEPQREKNQALDATLDAIRQRYGKTAIMRGIFADGEVAPLIGGVGEDAYPMMNSIF